VTKPSNIVSLGFNPPHEKRQEIELMTITDLQTRAPPEHFRQLQRADFFRLMGVMQGSASIMVDFSTLPLTSGTWLLIRPGQVVLYDFSSPWDGWQVVFKPEALLPRARSSSADETALLRRLEDLGCLSQLDEPQQAQMLQTVTSMQADSQLPCDMELRNTLMRLQLAAALLRLSLWQTLMPARPDNSPSALANYKLFRQLLEIEFAAQHQVQFYAQRLGMSEKKMARASHAAVGLSPKACIAQRLVLEAKRLLAHTHWPVQTIADHLGFDEATNFVKFFRRELALTPTEFRTQQP
jgi:AraC-like DNA-binding protein